MPLDPNPESYPPYSGQSYVQIHEQNLKGLDLTAAPNYTTQKYALYGRNPRFEIAQTIDAYKQNTEEFITADTTLTGYLASRTTTHAETIYTYLKSKAVNQDSNQQYVLGLSASMGGGQNTTYLANSISVAQNMAMASEAVKYGESIPVVVPFESALISQAHASSVEAKNMGEIRDQQIRQTLRSAHDAQAAANAVFTAPANGYSWDGASIFIGNRAQTGAAIQT